MPLRTCWMSLILVCAALAPLAANDARPAPLFKVNGGHGKGVEVYAHRGARSFSPENTLPAYKTGLRIGTHWMDCDIAMTRDGELVITHDLWLNPDIVRGADGKFLAASKEALVKEVPPERLTAFLQPYLIKNLKGSELKGFDVGRLNPEAPYASFFPDQRPVDGTHIPTLREVVRYFNKTTGGKVGFQIEIKDDPGHPSWTPGPEAIAKTLYALIKEEGIIDNVEIQAFDWACLQALQKLDHRIRTAYLTEAYNECADPGSPDYSHSFFNPDPHLAGLWTGGKLLKDYQNSIPRMVKALGGTNWEPEDAELTKEALDEAHALGLKVCTWTYPEHTGKAFDVSMIQKIIDWGVDGVITDDPGYLISILAAKGYPVPRRFDAR